MARKPTYEELVQRVEELEEEAVRSKQTENALRESTEPYKILFEHAGFGIILIDAETGKRVEFNKMAHESLGYTRKEYQSLTIKDIEHKESPEDTAKHVESIIKKGSDSFETKLKTKDGEIRDMFISAVPIYINGRYFIQNIRIDITNIKHAEEVLRESEERYRSLVESTEDSIYLVDRNCRYMFMNKKHLTRLGFALDHVIGRTYAEFHSKNDTKEFVEKIEEVFKTGGSIQDEHKSRMPGRYFLRTLSPINNSDGKTISVTVVSKDITDRKYAEEELKESSEKIKLFAYSISHDLKSPAIGLYGFTKRLHKDYADILDEKGQKYCEQILKTTEQIAALVGQINVFISTKETPLTIERLEIKEVLQMIREEFSTQLNIREISWLEPDYIPEIKADRLSIIRALRNLVDNALKYGGEALTEINIRYKKSSESHILSIKDNGIGLKEQDYHQDIFSAFIRRKTSKGIEGSGLGLTIVREIAEKHGGQVWLEPGLKRGITFYISIPKYLQLSR